MTILRGNVLPITFTVTHESRKAEWAPANPPTDRIDLVGEGSFLNFAWGAYGYLFFDPGATSEVVEAQNAVIQQYLNWPIALTNVDGAGASAMESYYLHSSAIETQSSPNSDRIKLEFRSDPQGKRSDEVKCLNATAMYAITNPNRTDADGVVQAELPTDHAQLPIVSYPGSAIALTMQLKVSEHELVDAVRSKNNEVLIDSTEVLEGVIPFSGDFPINIGAKATIVDRDFTVERMVRLDVNRFEARFERVIT